jgi:hypothetical protein
LIYGSLFRKVQALRSKVFNNSLKRKKSPQDPQAPGGPGRDRGHRVEPEGVVQITSKLERTGATRVLVQKDSPDGRPMGILSDSVIVADQLAAVLSREIEKMVAAAPLGQRLKLR